jgi:hypothetical protein
MRLIAEEGDTSLAAKELKEVGAAYDVVTTDQPIHRMHGSGSSVLTVEIRAGLGADPATHAGNAVALSRRSAAVGPSPPALSPAPRRPLLGCGRGGVERGKSEAGVRVTSTGSTPIGTPP